VGSIIAANAAGMNQFEKSLMGEGAGLDAMPLMPGQMLAGNQTQIAINDRHDVP
jgi:hypothetical protein